jgi:hypothetical protein
MADPLAGWFHCVLFDEDRSGGGLGQAVDYLTTDKGYLSEVKPFPNAADEDKRSFENVSRLTIIRMFIFG